MERRGGQGGRGTKNPDGFLVSEVWGAAPNFMEGLPVVAGPPFPDDGRGMGVTRENRGKWPPLWGCLFHGTVGV
jgi:hypothetical protein